MHLRDAAQNVAAGDFDRAAWRIADAGGLLRAALSENGATGMAGFDLPSGRGFVLPIAAPALPGFAR